MSYFYPTLVQGLGYTSHMAQYSEYFPFTYHARPHF